MKIIKNSQGQSLIILIIFMIMSTFIVTAAVAVIITNSRSTDKLYQGVNAYSLAESGIENALIRLLRNPNYTGEVLNIGANSATITVTPTGGETYSIVSTGAGGNLRRIITVNVSYTNNVMAITSWSEN